MRKFQILLLAIIALSFISCKNEYEQKFIKEWESKKTIIPGHSFIKIKPDYTFDYYAAGCQWRCNSSGNWKVINDTLILNSIPSKECQILGSFAPGWIKPLKKGEIYEPKTTIKNCKPNAGEAEYIEFKNDKFYIKKDTLEYVTNYKLPFGDRIAFFVKQ